MDELDDDSMSHGMEKGATACRNELTHQRHASTEGSTRRRVRGALPSTSDAMSQRLASVCFALLISTAFGTTIFDSHLELQPAPAGRQAAAVLTPLRANRARRHPPSQGPHLA
eukprot:7007625-Prymnesium_polylepis.2